MGNVNGEEFSYDDLMKKVRSMLTPDVMGVFVDVELTKAEIIKYIDDFDMYAEENESLLKCAKRYIELAMFKRICENYLERVLNLTPDAKSFKKSQSVDQFKTAFDNSDILGMIDIAITFNRLPTITVFNQIIEYQITVDQAKVFEAYAKKTLVALVNQLKVFDTPEDASKKIEDANGNGVIDRRNLEEESAEEEQEEAEETEETAEENETESETETTSEESTTEEISNEVPVQEKAVSSDEEVFDHDQAYYRALIKFSKAEKEKFLSKYPEDPDVVIMVPQEGTSDEEFFEAARFFNKKNSHIIAKIGRRYMRVNKYKSKQQMLDYYNSKK